MITSEVGSSARSGPRCNSPHSFGFLNVATVRYSTTVPSPLQVGTSVEGKVFANRAKKEGGPDWFVTPFHEGLPIHQERCKTTCKAGDDCMRETVHNHQEPVIHLQTATGNGVQIAETIDSSKSKHWLSYLEPTLAVPAGNHLPHSRDHLSGCFPPTE